VTAILTLEQIKRAVDSLELIRTLEEGFVAYSQGRVVVPPVGHLDFDNPPGDCHIKYGCVRGDEHFVVKIATGFYRNPDVGLPSSNGVVLVFLQKTGQLEVILLDEGWLTDVRTAAAGAIAAKHLGPRLTKRIGIVGTGTQARLQLDWLRHVTTCRDATVWGRNVEHAAACAEEMATMGFRTRVEARLEDLCASCSLIVTTTPSRQPLINAAWIKSGTHITAVGADGAGKQELCPGVFAKADIRVVDSLRQCREFGDVSHALTAGTVAAESLVELGRIIEDPRLGRTGDDQITVADLTGIAVQDIRIAELVLRYSQRAGS
jgi:ornithine cyclodeaminase/alanine dehydrogenase-like protein (mu-crystallin family)